MIVLALALVAQDDSPCHPDETILTDSRGRHCAPKPEFAEWPAKDCLRDFRPNDRTKIVAPLSFDGTPDLSRARLEDFDFKMVCGVKSGQLSLRANMQVGARSLRP